MKRYSHLISRLEKLEVEVNNLDDNGQFSHPSTRIRDDSSRASDSSSILACLLKSKKDDMPVKNSGVPIQCLKQKITQFCQKRSQRSEIEVNVRNRSQHSKSETEFKIRK